MKGKVPLLSVACLILTTGHHVSAAPAGKGVFASAKVAGAAESGSSVRLEMFMLPEIVINEPNLEAALKRLQEAYVDVCTQTGETPQPVSFVVPEPARQPLKVRLPAGDFHRSVLLLGSLGGMTVGRQGAEYRFSPLVGEEKITKRVRVAPHFSSQLQALAMTRERQPVARLLGNLGLVSDPAAEITLKSNGELVMTDVRSADVRAISQFCEAAFSSTPKFLKITLKVVELAKGVEVKVPKSGFLTESQALDFQKTVSRKAGADLTTLPACCNRFGEMSTIEIVRDFPAADNRKEGLKPVLVGKVVKMGGSPTGSKLDVTFDYSDTSGSLSPGNREVVVGQYAKLEGTGYFPDGATRVFTQARPDGSKTLLLVKPDVIDATGRLVRETL